MRDAAASPIVGYGDTRQQQGSAKSIAVGPTAKCPNCGQQEVGSTGQLWLLLVCDGLRRRGPVPGLLRLRGLALPARPLALRHRGAAGPAARLRLHAHLRRGRRAARLHDARLCACCGGTTRAEPHGSFETDDRRPARRRGAVAVSHRAAMPPPSAGSRRARRPRALKGRSRRPRPPRSLTAPPGGDGPGQPEDRAGLGDVARGSTLNLAGAALSAAATLGVTIAGHPGLQPAGGRGVLRRDLAVPDHRDRLQPRRLQRR